MKITVEFNNLQELDEFCNGIAIAPGLARKIAESTEAPQEAPKAPEAKKSTSKKETGKDEAPAKATAPKKEEPTRTTAPAPEKDKPADTEALKVEVRKLLAQVNKKTGSNTASQWIKELTNVEKLTQVEDAEELLALKAKAEEVLNG